MELTTHCPYDDAGPQEVLILPPALVPDANSPQVLGFDDPCCAHVVIAQHFMDPAAGTRSSSACPRSPRTSTP